MKNLYPEYIRNSYNLIIGRQLLPPQNTKIKMYK